MRTGFFSLHPATTLCFFLFQFALILVTGHPLILAASLICAFLVDFHVRRIDAVRSFALFYLPLLIFCAGFNSLFSHYGVTPLFEMKSGNNFTLEALVYGFVFGVKLVASMVWLSSFNAFITPEKIIFLFGRVFPRIALMLSMSVRFVPLFRRQSREIRSARAGVGAEGVKRGLPARLSSAASDISILITWAMERGIDSAASMAARGYGNGRRRVYSRYKFGVRDGAILAFIVVFSALFAVFRVSFRSSYNPIITVPSKSLPVIFLGGAFIIFGFYPLIFDFAEKRRWSV